MTGPQHDRTAGVLLDPAAHDLPAEDAGDPRRALVLARLALAATVLRFIAVTQDREVPCGHDAALKAWVKATGEEKE